jgi:hypothetical protein
MIKLFIAAGITGLLGMSAYADDKNDFQNVVCETGAGDGLPGTPKARVEMTDGYASVYLDGEQQGDSTSVDFKSSRTGDDPDDYAYTYRSANNGIWLRVLDVGQKGGGRVVTFDIANGKVKLK